MRSLSAFHCFAFVTVLILLKISDTHASKTQQTKVNPNTKLAVYRLGKYFVNAATGAYQHVRNYLSNDPRCPLGSIRRLKHVMLPIVLKLGIIATLLVFLTLFTLKGLSISILLLVLKISSFLTKFYSKHPEYLDGWESSPIHHNKGMPHVFYSDSPPPGHLSHLPVVYRRRDYNSLKRYYPRPKRVNYGYDYAINHNYPSSIGNDRRYNIGSTAAAEPEYYDNDLLGKKYDESSLLDNRYSDLFDRSYNVGTGTDDNGYLDNSLDSSKTLLTK